MDFNDLVQIGAWSSVIFKILFSLSVLVIALLVIFLLYHYIQKFKGRGSLYKNVKPVSYYFEEKNGRIDSGKAYVIGNNNKGGSYFIYRYAHVYNGDAIIGGKYKKMVHTINLGYDFEHVYAIYKNPKFGKGVDWTSDYEYGFDNGSGKNYFNCYLPGWE